MATLIIGGQRYEVPVKTSWEPGSEVSVNAIGPMSALVSPIFKQALAGEKLSIIDPEGSERVIEVLDAKTFTGRLS